MSAIRSCPAQSGGPARARANITLVVALIGLASTTRSEIYTWDGSCETTSWTAACADGPCGVGMTQRRNNWNQTQCGQDPNFPTTPDWAIIPSGIARLPNSGFALARLTIDASGVVLWDGGQLSVADRIENAGGIVFTHPGFPIPVDRLNGLLINDGVLDVLASLTLVNGELRNQGVVNLSNGIADSGAGAVNLFENYQHVIATGAQISVPVINHGILRSAAGTLSLGKSLVSDSGQLDVDPNAVLILPPQVSGIIYGTSNGELRTGNGWQLTADTVVAIDGNGLIWKGGVLGMPVGVALRNAAGGVLTAQTNGSNTARLSGTLINEGTLSFEGVTPFLNSRLENYGTTTLAGSPRFDDTSGTNLLDNWSILRKAGTGTSYIRIPVQNHGALRVEEGTLQVEGTLDSFAGYWDAWAGTNLRFRDVTLQGTFYGASIGDTRNAGNLNVGPQPAQLDFTNNGFLWADGNLTIAPTAVLAIGAGARFVIHTTINDDFAGRINNAGLLVARSGGSVRFQSASIENYATLDLQTGTWQSSSGTNVVENFDLLKKTTTDTANIYVPLLNHGTLDVQQGMLKLYGPVTQDGGTTCLSGGTLTTAQPFVLAGGTLAGNGTLTGPVQNTGGAVAPGASPGKLTISSGDYLQGADGTLKIEIAGPTAETQYDVLANPGRTAHLGGTLELTLLNGYTPPIGQAFVVMTFAARDGEFVTVMSPSGVQFSVQYNATNVTAIVTSVTACAGDVNCSGAVDFADIDPFVSALGYPGGVNWPHPDCPWLNADCNHDGDVDFADIDPFVAVIGTTCP